MNTAAIFSSKSSEWATPQDFFDKLNDEFNFNLDPCATKENAKCGKFFTEEQDGLKQNWGAQRILQSSIRTENQRLDQKGV